MSFRRELEDIRRQPKREAEQRRLKAELKAEQERREREQSELEAGIRRKREFQQYVLPVKPMVDRLFSDLADATWGTGNYGYRFVEGMDNPFLPSGWGGIWRCWRTSSGVDSWENKVYIYS